MADMQARTPPPPPPPPPPPARVYQGGHKRCSAAASAGSPQPAYRFRMGERNRVPRLGWGDLAADAGRSGRGGGGAHRGLQGAPQRFELRDEGGALGLVVLRADEAPRPRPLQLFRDLQDAEQVCAAVAGAVVSATADYRGCTADALQMN